MNITYQTNRLQLANDFNIAKGNYTHRNNLILILEDNGHYGYGELTEIDYYNIDLKKITHLIDRVRPQIEGFQWSNPKEFYEQIYPLLSDDSFLLSAFDCAAYDLYGKFNQIKIMDYLHPNGFSTENKTCSLTLGIQPVQEIAENIQSSDWPCFKIKLGTDSDLEVLKTIQGISGKTYRLDANEGWDLEKTIEMIRICNPEQIEFIEQPISRPDDLDLRMIKKSTNIPILADESFHHLEDLDKLVGAYHGINIKLMKCGGITPALEIIQAAKERDLKIMLGCMTETSIGITAAAQLIPFCDYVDLDGAMLIAKDLAEGVTFDLGKVKYNEGYGLGCTLQ